MGIAASGMNAAQTMLGIASNNIANANTPDFMAEAADLQPLPSGGVGVVDDLSFSDVAGTDGESNLVLSNEYKALANSRTLYDANAAVMSITDQMYGNLLDVVSNATSDSDEDNS